METPDGRRLLEGKVLFLAGAGPQMGAATAQIAAREGARVALAARSRDTAQGTAEAIRAAGGSAIALSCDLTKDEDIRTAVEAAAAQLGPIDLVFYNAGYYDNEHSSLEVDEEVWRT